MLTNFLLTTLLPISLLLVLIHPLLVLCGPQIKITNSEYWIPKLFPRISSCLLSCWNLKSSVFKNKLIFFTKLSSCFSVNTSFLPVIQAQYLNHLWWLKLSFPYIQLIITVFKALSLSLSVSMITQFKM